MNRRIKQGALVAAVVTGLGAVGAGCLTRPVETAPPNLKTNVQYVVHNQVIDKIDLLFDIDNSASMGDKQDYLKSAIPDLINRLINPNCVDTTMTPPMTIGPSANGSCTAGQLEFPPVHDMHLGILSSALGGRLGDACDPKALALMPFQNLPAHNDDQAHLLNRSLTYSNNGSSATEGTVADASNGVDQFLYWFPPSMLNTSAGPGTPVTTPGGLQSDFSELVGGVGVFGCGIESQLESWYRFLIQPDPYSSLNVNGGKAAWSGVDTVILQERHDFLRPDSLVAIIVLSDENDSEVDVRSLGQQGFNWMATTFNPPRGTSPCNTNPGDPNCKSCAQLAKGTSDANCSMGPYSNPNDWGMDLNLRHVHTKAKYGLDPQYPIQRYVNALTNLTVPDRSGEYPAGATSYAGMNDCTNPLFAGQLPDGSGTLDQKHLCQLPPGAQRTKDLVFYAHIGGVPNQLLHFTPGDSKGSTLTDADWVKILGNSSIPPNYDYTGIDPHMIESFQPRANIAPPGSPNNADPINGHEWVTDSGMGHILNVDRQYACIFPLYDANGAPTTRDCTQPQNQNFCDCPHMAGTVSAQQLPPICDQTTQTTQTGAKAYPTIRELQLAHLMGTQGIVSSICPIHGADNAAHTDPLYGYRPAVAVIVDRLKNALTNQCLPEKLSPGADGSVPCLILVQLPAAMGGTCKNPTCTMTGLAGPKGPIATKVNGQSQPTLDPDVLNAFCDAQEAAFQQQVQAAGGAKTGLQDPAKQSVCALQQLVPMGNGGADFQGMTCIGSKTPGWCYVTGAAAGNCPQALLFTANEPPHGAVVSLQCLEQSVGVLDSGAAYTPPSGGGSSSSSSSSGGGGGGG
jgi:hypothetical protein